MLIEKDVDPLALEAFKKWLKDKFEKLSEEERELLALFFSAPEEALKKFQEMPLKKKDAFSEEFTEMLFDYAEKRGWTWKDEKGEHFIWERDIEVNVGPISKVSNLIIIWGYEREKAEKVKKYLEELKQKGAGRFLKIWVMDDPEFFGISWYMDKMGISKELVLSALKREVEIGEPLSLVEALKIINWLLE